MVTRHVAAALAIRIAFILYGEYQDRVMEVPYTDVDYHVFTDAAAHVARGQSPYRRATYRYTPLLAWCLVPTVIWPSFGKVLFSILDVLVGYLIYQLVSSDDDLRGGGRQLAVACAALWWYNPLPVAVCSRGNAESLVLCLVLCALWLLHRRRPLLAGTALGAAVHLKLYPAVVAPALYWSLAERGQTGWRYWIMPGCRRLRLAVSAAATFVCLTAVGWCCYGDEFVQEAYLYHLTRRDVRHNFSVFFYMMYLTEAVTHWTIPLLTFLPQGLVVLALAVKLHRPRHLLFCAFAQVYAFVTFNKVCTSQYFLWYLSLLPATLPRLGVSWREAAALLMLWYLAQALWLLPAYLLEFEGRQVFLYVWAASVAFFCVNVGILARLVITYDMEESSEGDGKEEDGFDGEERRQTRAAGTDQKVLRQRRALKIHSNDD